MDGFDRVDTEEYAHPSEGDDRHLVQSAGEVADMIVGMRLTLTQESSNDFGQMISDNPLFDPKQEDPIVARPSLPPRPVRGVEGTTISVMLEDQSNSQVGEDQKKRDSIESSTLSDTSTQITDEEDRSTISSPQKEGKDDDLEKIASQVETVAVIDERYAKLLEVMEMTKPDV